MIKDGKCDEFDGITRSAKKNGIYLVNGFLWGGAFEGVKLKIKKKIKKTLNEPKEIYVGLALLAYNNFHLDVCGKKK